MASVFDVGSIAAPGADFASTGPHLHVGIQDSSGKYLNPETARSFLLNRILVGKNRTPLYAQQGSDWSGAYPVTSQFGHREAPTAGASTEHQGVDIGIPQGTKLAWSALPGDVYTPDKGYGSIQTTDAQGRPYTVKLLHTTPGTTSQLPMTPGQQPGTPIAAATGNVYNIYFNKNKENTSDFLSNYLTNNLGTDTAPAVPAFNYQSLLAGAFAPPTV
jgi:murein DD-endopeptidase MepM/ murein hydrolase activator NlpD